MTLVERLIRKWLRRGGFGHYHVVIRPLTEKEAEDAWMMTQWDCEEEAVIWAVPEDDTLPPKLLELVVIHEVGHGICRLAQAGDTLEEVACNRIVRMVHPKAVLPNEWSARMGNDSPKDLSPARQRQLIGVAIDAIPYLTDTDRELLNGRLYEKRSYRQLAERVDWYLSTGDPDAMRVKRHVEKLLYAIGNVLKMKGLA